MAKSRVSGPLVIGDAGYYVKRVKISDPSQITGTPLDTGFDLPLKSIMTGLAVDVITAVGSFGTPQLDMGILGASQNALLAGYFVNFAQFNRPAGGVTFGGNNTYVDITSAGYTLGTFNSQANDGEDVVNGGDGHWAYLPYPTGFGTGGARRISLTAAAGTPWDGGEVDIYMYFIIHDLEQNFDNLLAETVI